MSFFQRIKRGAKRLIDKGTHALSTPRGLDLVGSAGRKVSSYIPFEGQRKDIGRFTGGAVGRTIGGLIGRGIGTLTGNAEKGSDIGAKFAESTLGFKKGGRVKKSGKYLVHRREFVVPKAVKITKKQKKRVAKRRSK